MNTRDAIFGDGRYKDHEIRYDVLNRLNSALADATKENNAYEHELAKRTYDALANISIRVRTHATCVEEFDKAKRAVFGLNSAPAPVSIPQPAPVSPAPYTAHSTHRMITLGVMCCATCGVYETNPKITQPCAGASQAAPQWHSSHVVKTYAGVEYCDLCGATTSGSVFDKPCSRAPAPFGTMTRAS